MIDMFILVVLVQIIDRIFVSLELLPLYIRLVIYYSFSIIYFAVQEASSYQATLGKRLLNLAVCDEDGERLTLARAFARNIVRLINWFIFSLGYVLILFTAKEQGLHDKIVHSLVVDISEADDEEYDEEEYNEEN